MRPTPSVAESECRGVLHVAGDYSFQSPFNSSIACLFQSGGSCTAARAHELRRAEQSAPLRRIQRLKPFACVILLGVFRRCVLLT